MAFAPWGEFVSRRMFVPRKSEGLELPPCTHRLGCAKLSCWTGGSYSPSGCRHTEETNNWHLSLYGWLSALIMLKQIESQRSTGCDLLLLLSGGDERINTTLTSDWRKTVPRHICRHSPINETNGRLLTGTPTSSWDDLCSSRRCVPLQYAFMRGL